MGPNMITTPNPRIVFSHVGVSTLNLAKMEEFYTSILGMTVTDRGSTAEFGFELVFMSTDPNVHHQVVIANGRPENLPPNTIHPAFGPSINQISFGVASLSELRLAYQKLKANGYPDDQMMLIDHGIAWSIYFHDPEGNPIEIFADTEWFVPQPFGVPFDFSISDQEISERTEKMCRAIDKFEPIQKWRARISHQMGLS